MIAQLFDNSPSGYFAFLEDGSFVTGNPTFHAVTGYTKEELEGKKVDTVLTVSTRIFCQTHFFPMLQLHGHAEEIYVTLLAKDGSHIPVLMNARQTDIDGRRYTGCGFITVHNRKKFEEELIAARKLAETALRENSDLNKAKEDLQQNTEQLERQIQLAAKQNHELMEFSHVVTHNLKEPLRKILLYSERLGFDQVLSETIQKDIERVSRSAAQLKKVIEGLQQYIWLNETAHRFTRVDLSMVVQKALKQIMSEQPGEIVDASFQQLPEIEADETQLLLLFYHLLQNAVKFKREDRVFVSINATLLKQNWFRGLENKYRYDDFVKIEIRDKGIGFDPAYKETLFQIFRKLHYQEGQGLGLALCRKITANHHGMIEADSELNEYTLVTVWLPVKQSS